MCDWLNTDISFFCGTTDPTPSRTITVRDILRAITRSTYRPAIDRLRSLRTTRGETAYKAAKTRLEAVTFAGLFHPTRSKTTLVQHSGLVHGDVDHLADAQAVKAVLYADTHMAYSFISPSGDGLKLGVPIALVADDAAYKYAWQGVADYYLQQYGVRWDPSGKDICRLCFVSWDPTLYINPDAQPFPVPPVQAAASRPSPPPSPRRTVPSDRRDWYARQALDTAVKMIDASTPGNRHQARTKAAYLLGGYVAGGILRADEALHALEAAVQRNTEHLPPSLKTIEACLTAGMQEGITLEQLEQERLQWRATHWHTRARAWTGQLRTVAAEEIPPWR